MPVPRLFYVTMILIIFLVFFPPGVSQSQSVYITAERSCPSVPRCWQFEANAWHVEGESEALNQGHSFAFDHRKKARVEGFLHPGGERAEMVLEVYDDRYHLLHRESFRVSKPTSFSTSLADVGQGTRKIFVFFPRGGVKTRVKGRLVY
ncbi:hypothetical protein [Salinithrix halophila]|uniref:Uncharacterized protein n=1 Tax=Salinithrix halophila TaxID=1485204 RepID=A0ABV8JJM1_9BACL